MEDLLEQLHKEASSAKFGAIKEGSLLAKELLESQSNLLKCSPYDLRATCLKPLQEALEARQARLISLAVTGFHRLLRDNQFYSEYDEPDETKWLPSQLLSALQSLPSHSEDVQVELLKVLLSMSCIPDVSMSGHLIVQVLGVCGLAYGRGNPAMKSASQAAAVQSIVALLNQIIKECEEQEKDSSKSNECGSDVDDGDDEASGVYDFVAPAFDELVPVINYIAEKLTEANKHRECKKDVEIPALFLLECANSIMEGLYNSEENSLSATSYSRRIFRDKSSWQPPAYCSTLLVSSLWQRLCPALIALLGTPVSMRVSRGSGRTQGQMGRGSGTAFLPSLLFNSQEAKAIYSVACNLVVAMGTVGEMRPVLESLFHRMLLYPPPLCRKDSLREVGEIMKSPAKLVQLAGPILHSDPRNSYQNDLSLFRLTMDSLIECSNCSNPGMQMTIISCISSLLSSLEVLCEGKVLSPLHATAINEAYPCLEDVDYSGPLTYDNHRVIDAAKFEYPDDEESFSSASSSDQAPPESSSQHSSAEGLEPGKGPKTRGVECRESKGEEELEKGEEDTKGVDCENGDRADCESNSSGDTEGPAENETLDEEQQLMVEEEDERLLRLSESLGSKAEGVLTLKDEERERERLNAQHFCVTLRAFLPSLLAIRSTIEVDEAILEFSSKYCQGVFSHSLEGKRCPIIINADGIYFATYAALSLNLKLMLRGFYCQTESRSSVMSQDQFVESVYGSGVLVYLSSTWIGEVYNQIVKDSFLQRAGHSPHSPQNCALINLLTEYEKLRQWDYAIRSNGVQTMMDLDGLGKSESGSQMLSDLRRLEKATSFNVSRSASKDAGLKLCRRILTCCWESIVSILGTLLKHLEGEGGILAPIRLLLMGENSRKDEARRGQDTLVLCLNSLQSTARLANILGLQKRCGMVFSLLSSACLPRDDRNPLVTPKSRSRFKSPSISKRPLRLHKAHVLSFHVMMSSGLELGSHAPDCWGHLFRCCLYLSELERKFFSASETSLSFSTFGSSQNSSGGKKDFKEARLSTSSDDYFSDDFGSSANVNCRSAPSVTSLTMEDLMSECEKDTSSSGFLSTHTSGKALCCLTLLIDKFFDKAATELNLVALMSFLKGLCNASQHQLFYRANPSTPKRSLLSWTGLKRGQNFAQISDVKLVEESLLLHRVGEVMLKVVRSGRPLIHIMKLWAVAGPHFLEASCHKDAAVSKKAICCIHDIVNALLGSYVELPHFHFNEALFKPFENLLCLELCDIDIQDQIVSSICEFVESCNSEIKSGWRPLFGALRCVRAMPVNPPTDYPVKGACHETVGHLRAVKDVFEAFLSTDNVLVFANAALDCILCLLKHVKGPSEGEVVTETVVCWGELVGGDLCLDALRYIHRCAVILSSMYMMPTFPVFHSAHRINVSRSYHLVDCCIPGVDENSFWSLISEMLNSGEEEKVDYKCLWPEAVQVGEPFLQQLDGGSSLLQVWYVLLEGLAGAVITCPRRHQPQVLDTLFTLMRSLPDCPGPTFGIYCVNHLLLPLMQEWLRRSNVSLNPDWDGAQSFKQYTGLTSDLVVDYLKRSGDDNVENEGGRKLMLQQTMIVLVECVSSSSEIISRLGCSCIRHIVVSCGDKLHPHMWEIVVCSLHRASQVSLFPLYQLMNLFCPESPNFYGDTGQVKVAARRDCLGKDSDRLRQISHQVFLLDSQRSELRSLEGNPDAEDRSFIFLLFPLLPSENGGAAAVSDKEASPIRVPFRSLVVGLLANQMILQTLGQILVKGSPHVVPSLANVLLQESDFSHSSKDSLPEINGNLPGMLQFLSANQIEILLHSLRLSYEGSVQFDKRPGLKFLIQKVSQSERAANLYKQAGASWSLRMLTLFDLILSRVKHGLVLDQVKCALDDGVKEENVEAVKDVGKCGDSAPNKPTTLLRPDTQNYIHSLRKTFGELCEAYLELVSNRIDKDSVADLMDDQPIFFLTIPADEFPTSHRKSLEKWMKSLEEFNKDFMKSKPKDEDGDEERCEDENSGSSSIFPSKMILGSSSLTPAVAGPEGEGEEEEEIEEEEEEEGKEDLGYPDEDKKPFTFADLAEALDSDDDEDDSASTCTKEGDSGVASVTGVEQSVYSIATEKDISAMMGDYRRRKNKHSLPSQVPRKRTNPFLDASPAQHEHQHQQQQSFRPSDSVPPEIEEQRKNSLMKDSEAHLKVWTEMIVTVFDLISQLKDCELRPLLPLVFPTMRSLTAHAHDPHLRQVVAELLDRVACLYGFSPA